VAYLEFKRADLKVLGWRTNAIVFAITSTVDTSQILIIVIISLMRVGFSLRMGIISAIKSARLLFSVTECDKRLRPSLPASFVEFRDYDSMAKIYKNSVLLDFERSAVSQIS
jgi:hypothetical protein